MKIAMRLYVGALLAIAAGTTFAQGTTDDTYAKRVADAVAKYNGGKVSDATTDLLALYQENPKSQPVNSWLGFIYLRGKESSKAIPYLEQARDLSPKDLEVLNNLGNAYVLAGQKDKARTAFQQLLALDSNRFEAFYNLGNLELDAKHFRAAETNYTKAISLRKNSAQTFNNLGVAQEQQDRETEASGSFKQASDLEKGNAVYARNAANAFFKSKNYASAIPYFERGMKNGADDKEAILALADSYRHVGRQADVVRLMETYQDKFAGDPKYYFNLGVMKKEHGDFDGAETDFRKALSINEADKDSLDNLGYILFRKGNYAEARTAYEKLVAIDPSYVNRKNMAAAALREGDFRTAMPIWSDLLKANPKDQEVRLLLADSLFDSGDAKASLVLYKQILAAKPNSAAALDGIGRCHLQDANYAAAEAALRSAIKADKNFVPAYNNLAVVLEKMNKRSEAISILEKAASMDANNADVQKNLKRMKAAG